MSDYHNRDVFPRYVDHSYHDYSSYIEDGGTIERHKKSDRNFPALLHSILSDDQYSHMITWMPHGRAWKVQDKELLMREAVPSFFGQSKYASFLRQLNMWGFKRLNRTGPDCGCYYHQCFLRGKPGLTPLMKRVESGKGRVSPNVQDEPNFYLIAEQYPLEGETLALEETEVPAINNQEDLERAETEASISAVTQSSTSNSNQDEWDLFPPFDQDHPEPEAKAAPESAMNQYAVGNAGNSTSSFTFHCGVCKKCYDDRGQEFGWSYCEGCWVYYCEDCKLGVEGINAVKGCASCESFYCGKCRVSKVQGQGNKQWCSPTDCTECIQIAGPFLLKENEKVQEEDEEPKRQVQVGPVQEQLKCQCQKGAGIQFEELMLEIKELKGKVEALEEELKGKVGAAELEEKLKSMAI